MGGKLVETGLYLLEKKDKQLVQKLKPSDSKGVLQVRSIVEWIPGEPFDSFG